MSTRSTHGWVRSRGLRTTLHLLLAGSTALLAGCQGGPADTGEAEPPDVPPREEASPQAGDAAQAAPFDVGAVVRQVHFAYRKDGPDFRGGDSTYSTRVDPSGRIHASPYFQLDSEDDPTPADPSPGRQDGAPLVLETVAAGREVAPARPASTPARPVAGPAAASAPVPAPRLGAERIEVAQDGHLQLDRGDVDEHLRNGDHGVEQSWSFASAPAGDGDLTVRVRVEGEDFTEATDKGLHFQDPATGLGFSYGVATWVDAEGKRTEIRPRFEDGEIVLTVPDALVEASAYPAVLDPILGPELGTDNPVWGTGWADLADLPSVAFDASNYLVVWQDPRRTQFGTDNDILGARVTGTGVVLDPGGIVISNAPGHQQRPRVIGQDFQFEVVWEDYRNGNWDVYGTRVSSAGATLDPQGIPIATTSAQERAPAIAAGALPAHFVVWERTVNGGSDIYGAQITQGGVVGGTLLVSGSVGNQTEPDIVYRGGEFLAVWSDTRTANTKRIYGTRITSAGAILDFGGKLLSGGTTWAEKPRVAYGGNYYFAVWQDYRNGNWDIYGARMYYNGTVSDGSSIAIRKASPTAELDPAVFYAGSDFQVAWTATVSDGAGGYNNTDIHLNRVSPGGVVQLATPVEVAKDIGPYQRTPAFSYNGGYLFLVWTHADGSWTNIRGKRVSTTGQLIDPAPGLFVSTRANSQYAPAVGFDGTNYLLVWTDFRSRVTNDIYATRVSTAGAVLDPSGIAVSTAGGSQSDPALAFDGTNYLVVWEDTRNGLSDIYGARVAKTGTVLSGLPISQASGEQINPSIAFDGVNHLVVWEDARGGGRDVYAGRISPAGARLDADGFAVSAVANDQTTPAVACDPTNCLAVWSDRRNGAPTIYGSLVTKAGVVQAWPDGTQIAYNPTNKNQVDPSVAWNGQRYVTAWSDSRYAEGATIHQTPVALEGFPTYPWGAMVSPPLASSVAYTRPAVASNGTAVFLVYEGVATGVPAGIFGAKLDVWGNPVGATVQLTADSGTHPTVGGGSQILIAHDAWKGAPPYGATRVVSRTADAW